MVLPPFIAAALSKISCRNISCRNNCVNVITRYPVQKEWVKMNTRQAGTDKERFAAEYLKQQGMHILEQNFRARQGEIDLIGSHEGYLVFVEVKYRSSKTKGTALDAVDIRKQRQICKVADYYRMLHKVSLNTPIRYDVVAVQGENEIQWLKNAFPHIYRS